MKIYRPKLDENDKSTQYQTALHTQGTETSSDINLKHNSEDAVIASPEIATTPARAKRIQEFETLHLMIEHRRISPNKNESRHWSKLICKQARQQLRA